MKHFLFFFFCCLLLSCQAITVPVIKKVDSLKIESIENTQAHIEMILSIENPNGISIEGKDLRFDILYQNVLIGSGTCPESFELKNKVTSQVPAQMTLFIDSIPEQLRMKLFEMDSILLNVQLSFQGKLGLKHHKESEFKLPVLMLQDAILQSYMPASGIKLDELTLTSSSSSQSIFSGKCSFFNSLPADIQVFHSDIKIYSDRKKTTKVGQLILNDTISVVSDQTNFIPCKILIDNFKAMSVGIGKMMNGSLDFYAIGPVQIQMLNKEFKIPLSIHFSYNPMTGKVIILE